MSRPLVLSLFPGADLFGRAFQLHGCCVVKGPDVLLGSDIQDWHAPPAGRFDGVIAGPPCQPHSVLKNIGGGPSRHADYIPWCFDFIASSGAKWGVIENVPQAFHTHAPPAAWGLVRLNDWDCGGLTHRRRIFYVWPRELAGCIPIPPGREGRPAWSVIASSGKKSGRGGTSPRSIYRHENLTPRQAGELQGWPEIVDVLEREADVGKKGNRLIGARLIVHYLGNGVPRSMGEWIAKHILAAQPLHGGLTDCDMHDDESY
jgi:DNA (cytosine-5)-methyltransferase 1